MNLSLTPTFQNGASSASLNEASKKSNTTAAPHAHNVASVVDPNFLPASSNGREWSAYGFDPTKASDSPISVIETSRAEGENEVKYSSEKIIICHDPSSTEIPKNGSFRAGAKLRTQVAEELFDTMVSETLKAQEQGDSKTRQQRVDEGRNTSTILKNPSSTPLEKNKSPTPEETATFFKGKDYDLSLPAGSLLNQTLGHTCLLLYSQAPLPKIHEQKNERDATSFECLEATGAIGFPCSTSGAAPTSFDASNKKMADLEYEVEKKQDEKGNDSFFIKYTSHANSYAFYLRDKKDQPELPSEAPAKQVMLDEHIQQSSFTTLEIKIVPNTHFNKELSLSKENFPCTVECLDLRNSYKTEIKPQAQPDQTLQNQAAAATAAVTKTASQIASQATGLFKTATSFLSSKKTPKE